MDMSELPEPWSTAAERAGVRQTYRGIGDAAGISHVTVRRLIAEGRTSPATIAKVAGALRVDEAKVYRWASVEMSEWGPWTPPAEAHRLNPRAQAALEELIRAMVQGGNDAGDAEAEKKQQVRPLGEALAELDLMPPLMTAEDYDLAARRVKGSGKMMQARDDAKRVGEESQEDGGWEPA